MTPFINFPVFFLKSHAPLTCVWSETGNPRQPLACRWIAQPQQPGDRESAPANPAQDRRPRRRRIAGFAVSGRRLTLLSKPARPTERVSAIIYLAEFS